MADDGVPDYLHHLSICSIQGDGATVYVGLTPPFRQHHNATCSTLSTHVNAGLPPRTETPLQPGVGTPLGTGL